MSEKITKGCPFCRAGPIFVAPLHIAQSLWAVRCLSEGCGALGPEADSRDKAIAAWNAQHALQWQPCPEGFEPLPGMIVEEDGLVSLYGDSMHFGDGLPAGNKARYAWLCDPTAIQDAMKGE